MTGQEQDAAFDNYVRNLVIDNTTITQDVLDRFKELFPENDRTLGAPFNTGDPLFDRGEAWYTVEMFLSVRRLFFEHGASHQPMFAYYFTEFIPGGDPALGGGSLVLAAGPVLILEFASLPRIGAGVPFWNRVPSISGK